MSEVARYRLASEILTVAALFFVLKLGLLGALLPALLIFQLVQALVPPLRRMGISHGWGRTIALAIPAAIIGTALTYGVVRLVLVATGPESLADLLQRMADVVDAARRYIPGWAHTYIPDNIGEIQATMAEWLREHAGQVGSMGQTIGRVMFHIIIGLVVGGLLAIRVGESGTALGPFAQEIEARVTSLGIAFRNIVFSQIRISAVNTVATAIYLGVVLPMFGVDLPLLKTMIAVTFIAGLIPILGNLISNTVIVIVCLSVSPVVAAASLAYLVIIHKFEYFLNARIIGTQIKARAWELLTALVVMEAAFGIPGLIAAPIYYAFLKQELTSRGLI